jgi:hypothetical protein
MLVRVYVGRKEAVLENDHVRLELSTVHGAFAERVLARRDGWQTVFESRSPAGEPELDFSPRLERCRIADQSPTSATLECEGTRGSLRYVVLISLRADERFFRYVVEEQISTRTRTRSSMSRYAFSQRDIEFCFAPHLRPHKDDVVGQFAFKSPAIIMQGGMTLGALIADVELIEAAATQHVCLEPNIAQFDGEEPTLAYGFKDHEPTGLIFMRHRPDMVVELEKTHRRYGYRLYASCKAEPRYGYREIVRLLWRLYGAPNVAAGAPQVLPMDSYNDYALGYAIPTLWRELPRDGIECGGMVMGIKFPNDIWFHFFFNHLHTAFGLYRMGLRRDRPDLIERARKIRNLIVTAPRPGGAIPAIFSHEIITGIRHDQWIPHAHWVGGFIPYQTQITRPPDQPAYSTMDMAWTSYWMLRWSEELDSDERLVAIAKECGELLLRSQLPSGSVPVWLHKDSLEPLDFLRESPSCAAAGVLFAKLYESTKDERYLLGAKRLAAFVGTRFMPQGWNDYETLFDSAGKAPDLVDPYSGQRPQCTFPIFWTAELCKLLHRTTQEERYLTQALRAIDYLLLFQAVWSPPYLTVKGVGSIGIGNGHTGWNDARTGIFAAGIAEFFSLSGEPEYLERSVAAMRAPLALMYIPENEPVSSVFDKGPLGYADECYAHRGRDARLGPSTFDFSVGYALMAHEELVLRFGSAFIDLERCIGVGIDGCAFDGIQTANGRVDVRLHDRVGSPRVIEIGVVAPERWAGELKVNGNALEVVAAGQGRVRVQL